MKYTGTESNVTIPDKIDNKVVKTLGAESFTENETVVGVTIPAQVTNAVRSVCIMYEFEESNFRTRQSTEKIKEETFEHCQS